MTTGRINQVPIVRFPLRAQEYYNCNTRYATPKENNTESPGLPPFNRGKTTGDTRVHSYQGYQALLDQAIYPEAFTLYQ